MKTRSGSGFAAASALLAALAIGVPAASAVVVHTPSGQFLGIVPHSGVAPASIPGSIAAQRGTSFSSNGTLNYHGGPVVHSSAAYLIFWTPNGFSIPASSKTLLQRYFTDSAADSGTSSNAFAVARQFTDGSGFADYKQTFSASSQVISDTQGYPVRDQAHCPENIPNAENGCVTDAQIQAELQRLVTTLGLPNDGSAGSSSLPAKAPIYFVVLPSNMNVCDSASSCADNLFCAYHSSFSLGSPSKELLYATVPFLAAAQFPKNCQFDGNARIQEPNGDLADVALKFLSHEHNEAITDPTGGGWYDNASGNEDGDNCNATGPSSPHGGSSPNAFLPTLGGSASAGTLYDELIAGDRYYLQSEWSNGDIGCQMAPSAGSITPQFTVPSSIVEGASASFSPGASSSSNPISSVTWDFGDGTTTFKTTSPLTAVSHTYAAPGQFTVKLTLVDNRGNLVSTTQQVTVVDEAPTATFTIAPSHPAVGQPVSFDGSSSSDPDGSVASYSWDFGDGNSITGPNAVTPSHSYSASGVYTVILRVTDTSGVSSSTTRQIPVGLVAAFAVTSSPPLLQGQSLNFDASNSLASPGATITSYTWDFGDNSAPETTGNPTASHTYPQYGSYTVSLTVTDTSHATATTTQVVLVHEHPPTASFTVQTALPLAGQPVLFDGSSSSDPDGPITSYSWNFGDGGTAGGATLSHTYTSYGTYSVTLTVTVADGQTASTTKQVVVKSVPAAAFAVLTGNPAVGRPVVFDGSRSSDPTTSIVSYSWDFGDGATGTGSIPSHAYSTYGTYTVTLTITDANGLSNSTSQQVAIHDPPIGRFSVSPAQPVVGSSVGFDATGSSDPEPGATISAYSWNFGDGSTASGSSLRHIYQRPGAYTVTLTVASSFGTTATTTKQVTVVDLAPTPVIVIGTAHPVSGQPVQFDGSRSTDPADPIVSYSWSFGDGATAAGARVAHAYRKPGSYRVALTVIDAAGTAATAHRLLRIAPPRITRIQLRSNPSGATMVIFVDSAGVVSTGHTSIRIRHRGSVRLQIRLSTAQLQRLGRRGSVTLQVTLRFAPRLGPSSRMHLKIVFSLPLTHGRRVYARLQH
jgi:PKD repeat protein